MTNHLVHRYLRKAVHKQANFLGIMENAGQLLHNANDQISDAVQLLEARDGGQPSPADIYGDIAHVISDLRHNISVGLSKAAAKVNETRIRARSRISG